MKSLIAPKDKHQMNWVEGFMEWGTVKAPKTLKVEHSSQEEKGILTESYRFTNISDVPVFTSLRDISIYTTFADDYCSSEVCTKKRCHTHIWCGGEVSYVMALRMGGEAPHLGLVLTKGSLAGYSIERDLAKGSNDRGDFLLHPSPTELEPGESFDIQWKLFWHEGKDDFYRQLPLLNHKFLRVEAKQYVVFAGEDISLTVTPAFDISQEDIHITRAGKTVKYTMADGIIHVQEPTSACNILQDKLSIYGEPWDNLFFFENTDHNLPASPERISEASRYGEHRYEIEVGGVKTFCRIYVLPEFKELVKRRCHSIVEKQQFHKPGSPLDGAYLIYDREEGHCVYRPENDFNGGRERVGMGVLIARYLQSCPDEALEKSLRKYVAYVERELYDEENNLVTNDIGYNDSYKRLYNYPWVSLLYLELYTLWGDKASLRKAYKIMKSFYTQGGSRFYAIEIPLRQILLLLKDSSMDKEYDELKACFAEHCNYVLQKDILYPAHEVNYEQSIVAPAANLLLQMYQITGEESIGKGAGRQLKVLELFNGLQPDYRQYEVAVRHWDGYWFGKKRQYGDTYPHYWSALTGNAYLSFGEISGDAAYREKAEAAFRGVLSLFFSDGGASCAYVFPASVNGEAANRYDAYANDQDWGMYFYLREHKI
jgi:hypothetical protein